MIKMTEYPSNCIVDNEFSEGNSASSLYRKAR